MATVALKQEISTVLKDVLLKVCQKIAPFTEQLELHGLLLLETDGEEFCTVTFKDAKVTKVGDVQCSQINVETDRSEKSRQECLSTSLRNGESDSQEFHSGDGTAVKQSLINVAVQDAIDLWEGIRSSSHAAADQEPSNNNGGTSSKSNSLEEIIKTYENKKRSWNQLNWRRDKNKNGKYECPFCYREFSYATNLTRHQRTHHGRPQIRKPRPVTGKPKKSQACKGHDCVVPAGGAALESQGTLEKNSENVTAKENNCTMYNHTDAVNVQSNSADVNISSGSPEIDYSDNSKTTQSFLAQNSDFTGQGSVSIELSSSYMQTEFLTDDVYFGMPDADSASETTPRISSLPTDNNNSSDAQEFARLNNNNNTIVLPDSYMTLPVALDNPRDVTPQTSSSANTNTTDVAMDTTTTKVSTVFKTKAGKEYVSIESTENRPVVHSCPLCHRKFDFYQNLGRHVSVSHGISIFQLEMQRSQSAEMQTGVMQQADDKKKRFKCDICGHSFSFRSNLCRHKSKHHGSSSNHEKTKPYTKKPNTEAEHCGQNEKEGTKSGQAKYKCDICGVMFTFTSSLSRHMRKKHSLVRADLYKTAEQAGCDRRMHSGTNLAGHTGDNVARINQAEFAIPLTSYLPYGVSGIVQSEATNATGKDSRTTQNQSLHSVSENKQQLSAPSLNATALANSSNRTGPCLPELPSMAKNNNQNKSNVNGAQKNNDSNRVQPLSKAEAKTTTNIPKNNSSKDKKTESDKTKVSRKLPSERYRHKCNICNQMFTFRTNLTRHTRKIHRTCPDFPPETTPSAS